MRKNRNIRGSRNTPHWYNLKTNQGLLIITSVAILAYLFQNLFNVNSISSDNKTGVAEPSPSALRENSEEELLMLQILLQLPLQLGLVALCNALKQEKVRRRIITEPKVGLIGNFQKEHPHLGRIVESPLTKAESKRQWKSIYYVITAFPKRVEVCQSMVARWNKIEELVEGLRSSIKITTSDQLKSLSKEENKFIEKLASVSNTINGISLHAGLVSKKESEHASINFKKAYALIQDWVKNKEPLSKIDIRTLKKLHALLTRGHGSSAFRDKSRISLGRDGYFTQPSNLDSVANDIINFLKSDSPAIYKAITAQELLLSAHLFRDGNHRLASLIRIWVLETHGIPANVISTEEAERLMLLVKPLRMPGAIPPEEAKQLDFNSKDAETLAGRWFRYAPRFLNNIGLFSRIELNLERLYIKRKKEILEMMTSRIEERLETLCKILHCEQNLENRFSY
ncbi:CBU_0372 family Dot/Icm type IV secretion system effector [Coxiella burnetii]|uniref:CBU_0372 family Dot/Icm type IV secretion system effector n=1 Tax=Coxiella burnetii TaxID=777 RepID=UPI0022329852|nr:CBU_0372 family Dot/Icm type IV secretion system effector [Coxiella burnetii]